MANALGATAIRTACSTAPCSGSATLVTVGPGRASWLLRSSRRRAGISQAELARLADVPRTVVNAYERGTRQPAADTLALLLGAMGSQLEARPAPRVDVERNARILEHVLDLAERLPTRRRGRLTFPPLSRLGV